MYIRADDARRGGMPLAAAGLRRDFDKLAFDATTVVTWRRAATCAYQKKHKMRRGGSASPLYKISIP